MEIFLSDTSLLHKVNDIYHVINTNISNFNIDLDFKIFKNQESCIKNFTLDRELLDTKVKWSFFINNITVPNEIKNLKIYSNLVSIEHDYFSLGNCTNKESFLMGLGNKGSLIISPKFKLTNEDSFFIKLVWDKVDFERDFLKINLNLTIKPSLLNF